MDEETATRHRGRRLISDNRSFGVDMGGLDDDDADLYAAGLKSLPTLQLMVALEAEFGIEFPDEALHRRAFATVARIAALIDELRAVGAASAAGS
jgi:acyl carrier protein